MNDETPSRSVNRRKRYLLPCVALLVAVIALVAIYNGNHTSVHKKTEAPIAFVSITKDGFLPSSLMVHKGTKIIWTNKDDAPHQVYANPYPSGKSLPGLKSPVLRPTNKYEYVANSSGTFFYHDQLQPTTNATLQVKAE